jgi:hypothetical protein
LPGSAPSWVSRAQNLFQHDQARVTVLADRPWALVARAACCNTEADS